MTDANSTAPFVIRWQPVALPWPQNPFCTLFLSQPFTKGDRLVPTHLPRWIATFAALIQILARRQTKGSKIPVRGFENGDEDFWRQFLIRLFTAHQRHLGELHPEAVSPERWPARCGLTANNQSHRDRHQKPPGSLLKKKSNEHRERTHFLNFRNPNRISP
jgi:hypothetical protein